jgi:hypothetical protein
MNLSLYSQIGGTFWENPLASRWLCGSSSIEPTFNFSMVSLRERGTPLNNSIGTKGNPTIRKGMCVDQPGSNSWQLWNSLAALAYRLGINGLGSAMPYKAERPLLLRTVIGLSIEILTFW